MTVARPDELLTTIQLPSAPSFSGGIYLKFHDRQSMDMTTVGVSAFVIWDEEIEFFATLKLACRAAHRFPCVPKRQKRFCAGAPVP